MQPDASTRHTAMFDAWRHDRANAYRTAMWILAPVLLLASFSATIPGQAAPQAGTVSADPPTLKDAHAKLERGDSDGALKELDLLSRQTSPPAGLQHEYGLLFYRTGKLLDAESAFAKAMAEDPADKEAVQLRGLNLYRLGRPAAAIPYLEQVRGWTPDGNADANHVLGLCYLNARRYDDARGAFAAQYGVEKNSGPAWLLSGNMLMQADLPELASSAAQKALEANPSLPLAHLLLGQVLLLKSDVQGALAEFTKEQKINPGYALVYDRLGDVYTRMGSYQAAQESLTRAISLDRSSTGPFIQMGKVMLRKGDPGGALMYLQHAGKMDPGNYITHTLLGQAYRALGKGEEAAREFDAASKLHVAGELKLPAQP